MAWRGAIPSQFNVKGETMDRYTELGKKWQQIMNRDGVVRVQILGVDFSIEEIGKDGEMIDMTLLPVKSFSKCSLLVTYDEFEKLLNSTHQEPMGTVTKIRTLLNILTQEFPESITYSINEQAIQPVIVESSIEIPELYQDGTRVTASELEKAVGLFKARLRKLNQHRV